MTLTVEGLGVIYPSVNGRSITALAGVNLTVAAGEFLVLIGPSGCGKSTLLSCLGGLRAPTTGRVRLADVDVEGPDPSRASFVFQDYTLLPWKTVIDNVAIGLRFAGVKRAERRAKALAQLDLVGLSEFAVAYPRELSGGMQQRVAVARALTMDPEILLMDEPFGAVDELSRRQLGAEMAQVLSSAGKTVVLVTHSLDEAIFWADRIVVMSKRPGRIVEEICINFPRPRELSILSDVAMDVVRGRLIDLLTGSVDVEEPTPNVGSESSAH